MIRVEKGQPAPEELAALLAVLHTGVAKPIPVVTPEAAAWSRASSHPAPSWQSTNRKGGHQ